MDFGVIVLELSCHSENVLRMQTSRKIFENKTGQRKKKHKEPIIKIVRDNYRYRRERVLKFHDVIHKGDKDPEEAGYFQECGRTGGRDEICACTFVNVGIGSQRVSCMKNTICFYVMY